MNFRRPDIDVLNEEVKRQKFIQSLVNTNLSSTTTSKPGIDLIIKDMLKNTAELPKPGKRNPPKRSKEKELEVKIRNVEDMIEETQQQLRVSQTSQKQLNEKLKSLERAISLSDVMKTEHPTEHTVAEFSKIFMSHDERNTDIQNPEAKRKRIHQLQEQIGLLQNYLSKTSFSDYHLNKS